MGHDGPQLMPEGLLTTFPVPAPPLVTVTMSMVPMPFVSTAALLIGVLSVTPVGAAIEAEMPGQQPRRLGPVGNLLPTVSWLRLPWRPEQEQPRSGPGPGFQR